MANITRTFNTRKDGSKWNLAPEVEVWIKGTAIDGYDAAVWRRDKCGTAMKFSEYGNRSSQYGWEIDHINPVSNGGGDDISNLQPLNWNNNSAKGDTVNWRCS